MLSSFTLEELQKYISNVTETIAVKSGTKEAVVLESMTQLEIQDLAIKRNAYGSCSSNDLENAELDSYVRDKVLLAFESIAIEHGLAVVAASSESSTINEDDRAINKADVVLSATTTNVVNSIGDEWDPQDDMVDPDKEKHILSEIEKFRQRQAQRDKDVNAQRKLRLREGISQLKEKQEREQRDLKRKLETEEKAMLQQQKDEAMAKSFRNADVQIKNSSINSNKLGRSDADDDVEAKQRRKQQVLEILGSTVESVTENTEVTVTAASSSLKIGMKSGTSTKKGAAAAGLLFQSDHEEETRKLRELVPLDFTVEERERAAQFEHSVHNETNGGVISNCVAFTQAQKQALALTASLSAAVASSERALSDDERLKEKQKQLVEKIPTEKSALFAYDVDWKSVDRLGIVDSSLKSWVVRKIVEYLGEEEATLTEFIMNKLLSHCQPQDLLTELQVVLDEDTEQFVIKLWRMLIFSILKATI